MGKGNGNQPDTALGTSATFVVGTDIATLREFIDVHARRQFAETKVVFVEDEHEDGEVEFMMYQVPADMTDYDDAVAYARQQMEDADAGHDP